MIFNLNRPVMEKVSEFRGFAPPAIARHERAGPIGIMGELVLNEVEGKEFFKIKMVYFHLYPQYSSIPSPWHKQLAIKRFVISKICRVF
jgi:hypothetical protein